MSVPSIRVLECEIVLTMPRPEAVLAASEPGATASGREGRVRFELRAPPGGEVLLELQLEQSEGRPWVAVTEIGEGSGADSWTFVDETAIAVQGGRRRVSSQRRPFVIGAEGVLELLLSIEMPVEWAETTGALRLSALNREGWVLGSSGWAWFAPSRSARWRKRLPLVYRAAMDEAPAGPLTVQLEAMAAMLSPSARAIATFPEMLDPWRTREDFLPLLGHWLGLGDSFSEALTPTRGWVAQALPLAQARGTQIGLERSLEVATGLNGFEVEEHVDTFHVELHAPLGAEELREAVERLVEEQCPAHVTYNLVWEKQP